MTNDVSPLDSRMFLKPADAARHLGLTAHGVRAAIRRGELEAVKFGRSWCIPRRVLEALVERAAAEARGRRQQAEQQVRVADEEADWTPQELRALTRRR